MAYKKVEIEKIFKEVIQEITLGTPLRTILLRNDMPSSQTFYKWLTPNDSDTEKVIKEKEIKSKQYARACNDRADAIFEECLAIADNQEKDKYTDEHGKEHVNHNVINRSRLRVDTRKWMLGKLNPKKYGDKMQQDVTIDDKRAKIDDVFPSTEELTKDEEE